jgi:hypothetical protein
MFAIVLQQSVKLSHPLSCSHMQKCPPFVQFDGQLLANSWVQYEEIMLLTREKMIALKNDFKRQVGMFPPLFQTPYSRNSLLFSVDNAKYRQRPIR